ncbi:MAG: NUDIX hydrolase [Actinomycetota bacterium]
MGSWPVVAVGAIIRHADEILLVLRDREPAKGTWSLPGGKVRAGETLSDACRREVREETGLTVEVGAVAGVVERMARKRDGSIDHHFLIIDLWATVANTTVPTPGDDAADARWFKVDALASEHLTPGLLDFLIAQDALAAGSQIV